MNFSNHTLAYEDLRDCTLITKNGTKIPVTIDYIETTADTFPKFEGHITGTAKVSYRSLYYIRNDAEVPINIYRNILNSTYGIGSLRISEIENVIFSDPATIVFWEDGTKTVVKCQDGDEFDPEKGLSMAIVKKAYGNKGNYCNKLKKWLPKEEQVDTNVHSKKRMTFREEVAKLNPEDLIPDCKGGVCGCPRDIDKCPYSTNMSHSPVSHSPSDDDCRACWDREIPDELMGND